MTKGATTNDEGLRYLRSRARGKRSKAQKTRITRKMETKMKVLLRDFKAYSNDNHFNQTLFASHWVECIEHHIDFVAEHTKKGSKLENVIKHLWKAFVTQVPPDNVRKDLISLEVRLDSGQSSSLDDLPKVIYKPMTSKALTDQHKKPSKAKAASKLLVSTELWDSTDNLLVNRESGREEQRSEFENSFLTTQPIPVTQVIDFSSDKVIEKVVFKLDKSYFNSEETCFSSPFCVTKLAYKSSTVDVELYFKPQFYPNRIKVKHEISFEAAQTASYIKVQLLETLDDSRTRSSRSKAKPKRRQTFKRLKRKSQKFMNTTKAFLLGQFEPNDLLEEQEQPPQTKLREFYFKIGNNYTFIEDIKDRDTFYDVKKRLRVKETQIRTSVYAGEEIVKSALIMNRFMKNKTGIDRNIGLGSIMTMILNIHEISQEKQLPGVIGPNQLIVRPKKRLKDSLRKEQELERLFKEAKKRLRFITINENILKRGFSHFLRLGLKNRLAKQENPLNLSQLLVKNEAGDDGKSVIDTDEIDYFVSHCWSDNVEAKIDKIIQFSKLFYRKKGRFPNLWIDLFCVDQDVDQLESNIQLLPVFLMACDKVLLFRSNRLVTRLWCLMEIYSRAVMTSSTDSAGSRIEIIDIGEEYIEKDIDCNTAKCHFDEDSELLRQKLDRCPGGISRVNKVISEALSSATILDL